MLCTSATFDRNCLCQGHQGAVNQPVHGNCNTCFRDKIWLLAPASVGHVCPVSRVTGRRRGGFPREGGHFQHVKVP